MASPLSLWLHHGAPSFPLTSDELKVIRENIVNITQDLDICRMKLENGIGDPAQVRAEIEAHLLLVKPGVTRVRDTLLAINTLEEKNKYADMIFGRLRYMQFVTVTMILVFELLVESKNLSRWIITKTPALSAFVMNVVQSMPVDDELKYLGNLQKALKRGFVFENVCICLSLACYAYENGRRAMVLTATYWVLFIGVCYVNKLRFMELLQATRSV